MPERALLALLLVAAASGPAFSQSPRQLPVFPARIDTVTVDVVVLDGEGRPVEGLRREDFTVREDGVPQAIATFEAMSAAPSAAGAPRRLRQRVSTNLTTADEIGRWFFVVFDDVNVSQFSTVRAREAIEQVLGRALDPGDRVMIATTSGSGTWTGALPEDLESLQRFVGGLMGHRRPDTTNARIWDHEAMAIALGRDTQALAQVARRYYESGIIPEAYPSDREIRESLQVAPGLAMIQTRARQTYMEAQTRIRTTLGALERLSAALAQARGRKTLFLVTEGFIVDPTIGEFRALVQAARNANVAVHFVDVRDPAGALGQPGVAGGAAETARAVEDRDATLALAMASREADGARSIAADTGGSVIAGVRLAEGLRRAAAEGRSYYLLGYSPANTRSDGRFRRIEVAVNRRDVEVRARGGYYADADRPQPKPSADQLNPAVRAALDAPSGTSGIPLQLASYVFAPRRDGTVRMLLVAEADLRPLSLQNKGGSYAAHFDSYVVVHADDGTIAARDERAVDVNVPAAAFSELEKGLPVGREFSLPPGRYQVAFLLRDRATGAIGSVRHPFDVPARNELRTSTPIVTDTAQLPAPGQPGRPVPIARRTFRPGSRLLTAFEVYGHAADPATGRPRVSVGYSLQNAAGTKVAGAAPQVLTPGADGTVSVTISLTVPTGATGDHELVVTVRDDVAMRVYETREALLVQ